MASAGGSRPWCARKGTARRCCRDTRAPDVPRQQLGIHGTVAGYSCSATLNFFLGWLQMFAVVLRISRASTARRTLGQARRRMVGRHCMREEAALDFKAAKFVSGRNAGHCGSLLVGALSREE